MIDIWVLSSTVNLAYSRSRHTEREYAGRVQFTECDYGMII